MGPSEREYLDRWHANNAKREDADVKILGLSFFVPKTVFSPDPRSTCSTQIVLDHLPDVHGKAVLDLGCGCGVIGIVAALRGASQVLLTDVDAVAITAAEQNAKRHAVQSLVNVIESNVFDRVDSRFDVIAANLPFIDEAWSHLDERVSSISSRFFDGICSHLNVGGTCLIPDASFAGDQRVRKSLMFRKIPFEERKIHKFGVTWLLYIVSKSSDLSS